MDATIWGDDLQIADVFDGLATEFVDDHRRRSAVDRLEIPLGVRLLHGAYDALVGFHPLREPCYSSFSFRRSEKSRRRSGCKTKSAVLAPANIVAMVNRE